MFRELSARHSLDETQCFVIGDTRVDMEAADAIGAHKILVKHGDMSVANAIHTSVEFIRANY
jgi:phosphoglycolate phosphatase-like HAD superfamily hydrolase